MVNEHRGEVELEIDNKPYILCLTLGALAELEAKLATHDLNGLAQKFSKGHICSQDLIAILGAGLRGAGHTLSDADLAKMHIKDGAAGAAKAAAKLIAAAFGAPEQEAD